MSKKIISNIAPDGREVLSNILHEHTGKQLEYKQVTGITDQDVLDGKNPIADVYIKRGSRYYIMSEYLDKGKLFLEKDSIAEVRAMSTSEILLLKIGYYKGVRVNGYYEKGDTPAPIEYFLSDTEEEDDGGSVLDVSSIKIEHIFLGEVDVKYYGIFDGYTGDPFISKIKYNSIFIDRGLYVINKSDDVVLESIIIKSNGGVIKASDDFNKSSSILIHFSNAINNILIDGITIDGNNQVSECLRIQNSIEWENSNSNITIVNSSFKNTIKDNEIGVISNNSCGIYVRGSFINVNIDNCSLFNHLSDGEINGASRGILVSENNNSISWSSRVNISNCTIKDIYRTAQQGSAPDADCIFVSNHYSTPYKEEETKRSVLNVYNCEFSNFSGRAVKSQVGNTTISGNKVSLKNDSVQVIFDFQRNQGIATDNYISMDNSSGTIFGINKFDELFNEKHYIHNNFLITKDKPTDRSIMFVSLGCGFSSDATYTTNIEGSTVSSNIVKGEIDYFANIRIQSESKDNLSIFKDNQVDELKSFFRTWRFGFTNNYGRLSLEFNNNYIKKWTGENPYWYMNQSSFIYFKTNYNNSGFERSPYTPNTVRVAPSTYTQEDGFEFKCDGVSDGDVIEKSASLFTKGSDEGKLSGKIALLKGDFIISKNGNVAVKIPSGISIEGDGINETILKFTGRASSSIEIDNDKGVFAGISNMTIDFITGNLNGGIRGKLDDFKIDNIKFINTDTRAIYTSSGYGCKNLTISNCVFDNCAIAILAIIDNNINISNCIVNNSSLFGIDLYTRNSLLGKCYIGDTTINNNQGTGIRVDGEPSSKIDLHLEKIFIKRGVSDISITEVVRNLTIEDSGSYSGNINPSGKIIKISNNIPKSSDTAIEPGDNYDKNVINSIITELRDLKNKMRIAGVLEA